MVFACCFSTVCPIAGLTRRSYVYDAKGDLDKAIADMTEVIRLGPESREAYERRADLYSRKHDTDKAAADTAQAVRLRHIHTVTAIVKILMVLIAI